MTELSNCVLGEGGLLDDLLPSPPEGEGGRPPDEEDIVRAFSDDEDPPSAPELAPEEDAAGPAPC